MAVDSACHLQDSGYDCSAWYWLPRRLGHERQLTQVVRSSPSGLLLFLLRKAAEL